MYISVDVGGSGIRVASSNDLKNIKIIKIVETINSGSFEQDLDFIIRSVRRLAGTSIDAVGVGVTGDIDGTKSMVVRSVNNPYWNNNPVVPPLEEALGCPVFLDNDAVAGALGEAYYGNTIQDFAYIVWGTGIGGVLVKTSRATRVPFSIDNINQQWDKYFREWHFACSGGAIVERYSARVNQLSKEIRFDIFNTFVDYLQTFMAATSTKKVVLGGGVATEFGVEFAEIQPKLQCYVSQFGEQVGVYGAFGIAEHALTSLRK